jgi:hypothetical protein
MASSAQKGPRAPESKDSGSPPQERSQTVTARVGPQAPTGVVEDSQEASKPAADLETSPSREPSKTSKPAVKSIVAGRRREAQVVTETTYPFAQVVVMDQLADPYSGLVVETIQEPLSQEEVDKALDKERKRLDKAGETGPPVL